MKPTPKHKGKANWLSVASSKPVRTPDPREQSKRAVGPTVKVKRPIRKRSVKMEAKMKVYHRKRRAFLKHNPLCGVVTCRKPATDIHHQLGRIGDLLLDEEHWVGLCRFHHNKAHTDLFWSRNNGIMAPKGQWLNPKKKENQ